MNSEPWDWPSAARFFSAIWLVLPSGRAAADRFLSQRARAVRVEEFEPGAFIVVALMPYHFLFCTALFPGRPTAACPSTVSHPGVPSRSR
jgi:hypothetical protein